MQRPHDPGRPKPTRRPHKTTTNGTETGKHHQVSFSRKWEGFHLPRLKVLRSEASSFRRLQASVARFVDFCQKASPDEYRKAVREAARKKVAQESLATDILPTDVALDQFKAFLESSRDVFAFPGQDGDPCPFCRRPLDSESLELVHKYHSFLVLNQANHSR